MLRRQLWVLWKMLVLAELWIVETLDYWKLETPGFESFHPKILEDIMVARPLKGDRRPIPRGVSLLCYY